MTLTFTERNIYKKMAITTVLLLTTSTFLFIASESNDDIKSIAPFICLIGFLSPLLFVFRTEKPLDKPIFDKCKHLTRYGDTRACVRCGIKVVWEGDEFRYND